MYDKVDTFKTFPSQEPQNNMLILIKSNYACSQVKPT